MDAEETKRWKAKQLRYKKPIVRDLNLDKIQEDLWNIMEECENIRWYTDSDDGNDSLINALDGDEDEAYEFKMAFAELYDFDDGYMQLNVDIDTKNIDLEEYVSMQKKSIADMCNVPEEKVIPISRLEYETDTDE